MKPKPLFIAECHFDTLLIEIIMKWKPKDFDHVNGTELFTAMYKRNKGNRGITVGIFDKNKKMRESVYISQFKVEDVNNGIQWLKHPDIHDQHILYLFDGAEEWFLEAARQTQISPISYEIPEKLDKFKRRTKKLTIRQDNKMYQFIKAVVRENPPQVQTLRNYILAIFGEQLNSTIAG
ncbi:MAG: hypothetical protein IPM69_15060 [Ignavibacteria bacterium]|nr:hypothetical protein [Ignavibacteria bacterium]